MFTVADRYRLRERREKLGLTQSFVAHIAGLRNQALVSMAERHGRPPWAVAKVRRALVERELFARACRRQEQRAARVEALWAAGDDTAIVAHCRAAMVETAIRCMEAGQTDLGDLLVEALPKAAACEVWRAMGWED